MIIKQTNSSPFVCLSVEKCRIEIKGNSYGENLQELYNSIIKWIDSEVPRLSCELTCVFHFSTVSSVSMKNLFVIILKLNKYYQKGSKILIEWHYDKDDEDIIETAEDLTELIDIPFKIIEVQF